MVFFCLESAFEAEQFTEPSAKICEDSASADDSEAGGIGFGMTAVLAPTKGYATCLGRKPMQMGTFRKIWRKESEKEKEEA